MSFPPVEERQKTVYLANGREFDKETLALEWAATNAILREIASTREAAQALTEFIQLILAQADDIKGILDVYISRRDAS